MARKRAHNSQPIPVHSTRMLNPIGHPDLEVMNLLSNFTSTNKYLGIIAQWDFGVDINYKLFLVV
jgi:hypothetical protein